MKKQFKVLLTLVGILSLVGCNPTKGNTTENVNEGFEKVTSVENMFKTYASSSDFNFGLKFACDVVYHREYYTSLETDYLYNGNDIQLTYESEGEFFTDYYHEDASNDTYIYYIDMGGTKEYQSIDGSNPYFHQYHSAIDEVNINKVDWVSDFIFNHELKQCKPASETLINENCKMIFGDRTNEFWDSLNVYYDGKYITKIEAVSIYREAVYYYTLTFSNHDWVTFDLPEVTKEYEGYHPYFNKEVYQGDPLTSEEKAVLSSLTKDVDPNYTVTSKWTYVNMDTIVPERTIQTVSVYDNQIESFTYTNASTGITYTDYLTTHSTFGYVYFQNTGTNQWTAYTPNDSENYSNALAVMAQDMVDIRGLNGDDFINNGEYLMPKDNETEKRLAKEIFGTVYGQFYYGIHIKLENNNIKTLETSIYIEYDDGSILSYIKEFTFSDIGTSHITLPDQILEQL